MIHVLVTVTACSLLSAFVFFLLWRDARNDARYWKRDADYWFDAWAKASKGRPRHDPADWWKGGGGVWCHDIANPLVRNWRCLADAIRRRAEGDGR